MMRVIESYLQESIGNELNHPFFGKLKNELNHPFFGKLKKDKDGYDGKIKHKDGINSEVNIYILDDAPGGIDNAEKIAKIILKDLKSYKTYFYKKNVIPAIKEMGVGDDSWIPEKNSLDIFLRGVKLYQLRFYKNSILVNFMDPNNFSYRPYENTIWYYDHEMSVYCDWKGKPKHATVNG